MAITLKDRVAIVTGGGGGLGREYALALAKAGAKVVVNDYGGDAQGNAGTINRAQSVVNEIKALGGSAIANGSDVSTDAKEIVQSAVDAYGRLDILINNAGIMGKVSPHDDVDVANFRRVLEVSAVGTVMMVSAAYPIMQKQKHGRIINVSSSAIMGMEAGGDCAYSASKGAVFAMTREMGRFGPQFGIKVNALMPAGMSRMASEPRIAEFMRKYCPAHKVAPFVSLLSSDECPISGEIFSVGAGRAARVTLATFPGSNQSTPEGYLHDFDNVMGNPKDIHIPKSTADDAIYLVKNATGDNVQALADFGIPIGTEL
ncbi:NAD(P)-binding protein [Aspergillus eucalypticola CBS 122712]|uniref:NAD(P)-binding protein n=1 Tax=Aspergillus eucalypticola (strain CBS 122712 / IBT 29274) TaxID=1448314 RepID=A0A317VLQ5_ASPEC|nr:NAD(P)-binding protein [Aspergillus eucalypticola CBS 122712]PWY74141.1 NAD(P)-binding protein [Aspergillus eucalypticola CBS 122712]